MEVNCEHPVIILNPSVKFYLRDIKSYTFNDGISYTFLTESQRHIWYYDFPYKTFSKRQSGVVRSNIDKFYYVLGDGSCLPMYQLVPCGRCNTCKQTKINSLRSRFIAETLSYPSKPYFITLTIAPKFYALHSIDSRFANCPKKRVNLKMM